MGLRHLAFTVDDVRAAEKLLRERGVPIVLPATDLPQLGARVVLFPGVLPDHQTGELSR